MGFISCHITPLVINNLGGGHTHMHTHTHACTHTYTFTYTYRHPHKNNVKRPDRHAWFKNFTAIYIARNGQSVITKMHSMCTSGNAHVLQSTFVTGPAKITMWV